jgi:hypothetical protein
MVCLPLTRRPSLGQRDPIARPGTAPGVIELWSEPDRQAALSSGAKTRILLHASRAIRPARMPLLPIAL